MDRVNAMLRRIQNALLCIIGAACILFSLYWFLSPDPKHDDVRYTDKMDKHIKSRFFRTDGYYGSVLIYQTLPFVVVAILGYAVIFTRKRIEETSGGHGAPWENNYGKNLRLRLGTFPLWVRSPLGLLNAADALFVGSILFIMLYHLGRVLRNEFEILEDEYHAHPEDYETSLTLTKVAYASYYIGQISNLPFALLWIPVSRGSAFLRLLRVPYERAVKYHIWLGVLTLFVLSVHSTGYITYFVGANKAKEIIAWETHGEYCSVVAGVVALVTGYLMWISSLSYFRRNWYEVFFAVHHLYIVFLLFWIYHVIWTVHFFSIPVLLFIVDRFLRFVQSRHAVTVLSATVLESGAMELRFPRNNYSRKGRLQPVYQALSTWYVKFPSLPNFLGHQWHALSVMSTPKDEKHELSIVIKPLGGWTNSLENQLTKFNMSKQRGVGVFKCPFSFKAGVEGPYGDESEFYLEYKSLVLVGGGIGVTPLLAIIGDILHRYRHQQQQQQLQGGKDHNNLPTSILLYHCVRKVEELCVLNSVYPLEILPEYNNLDLDIQVHAYVTSPNTGDEENAGGRSRYKNNKINSLPERSDEGIYDLASFGGGRTNEKTKGLNLEFGGVSRVDGISPISPTGETIWTAAVTLASIIGFFTFWGLTNVLWIQDIEDKFPSYNRAHLILGSMLLGTGFFGGAVIAGWAYHSYLRRVKHGGISKLNKSSGMISKLSALEVKDVVNEEGSSVAHGGTPWVGTLRFGRRPSWEDVFRGLIAQYDGQNVGVLVSGSTTMLEDIASQCRKHTSVNLKTLVGAAKSEPQSLVFHFHSVSFEL